MPGTRLRLLPQPLAEILLGLGFDVMPDRSINQGASAPFGGQAVEHGYGCLRQDYVDPGVHDLEYTHSECVRQPPYRAAPANAGDDFR